MIEIAKAGKVQVVSKVSELLENSNMSILAEYNGLTVAEMTELRRKLREADSELHVVKNTLFHRAAEGKDAAILDPYLEGPLVSIFAKGDIAASAKVLINFAKEHKQLKIKIGEAEGVIYEPDKIVTLSKLPSREVLYAKLMASVNGPTTGVMGVTQSVIRKLMGTIQAVAEKNAA